MKNENKTIKYIKQLESLIDFYKLELTKSNSIIEHLNEVNSKLLEKNIRLMIKSYN